MGKRKTYSTIPATYPIDVTIKQGGNTFVHRLKKGDRMKCIFCGKKLKLDDYTAVRLRHKYDDGVRIKCVLCGRMASAVYYTNSKNRISMACWDSGVERQGRA